ncbi:sugar ABC transporter substrate-binding protein [Halotalea alkalilenta]|uniref:Sugar ABC transporter substrate-binding protein n=1 Tax=Halotalea alkalilenta TaxID=376489 RepID=A0A172YKG5_9GAMM|nr:sugar ABC transporter substrate-binding protein [Halotalea alkalilenta]
MLGLSGIALPSLADGVPPHSLTERDTPIRVAVIRNLGADDNTTQFLAGARAEGASLGFKVDTFLSNGDDARFQDFVDQAIGQGYDAIILSQGRAPYSTGLVKRIHDRGIAVSVFDTAVEEAIPGVTLTYQDDASLTEASFGQLVEDFDGEARIIKLWVAGFPPMERRQRAYQALREAHPGIEELESIGAVSSDVQGDTANRVGALLTKYPPGTIDAIWGTWDAFSQGAYKALRENGRDDVAIYGIDISDQDLALMSEPGSPWRVSAAVDPALIGRINLRLVALKLAGEETPDEYQFKAAAIDQRQLAELEGPVNVAGLGELIPGWGESDDFRPDWYRALQRANTP